MELKRKIKSGLMRTLIINGKEISYSGDYITYGEVCDLIGINLSQNPSITYKCKRGEGILLHDEEIYAAEGIIINCMITGNS